MTTTTSATPTQALNSSGNVNISGFFTDEEHEDIGFTELQTVGIACVATLIPLALTLFAVFGLRMVWKNWRGENDERTLRRTDSSDPNKSSHLLLPEEIKTSESQFSVIPAEELEEVLTSYNSAPSVNSNNHNHTSKSTANGSIITMTMKNNHLIVETEERLPGETETVYTEPSPLETLTGEEGSTALVHHSGEESGINTGMSQSDLSVSSSGSANPAYCYGNQVEYLGDERDNMNQIPSTTAVRLKHVPFMVQPSQDIEDDDLYLEQQHQLGNGMDDVQAVPDLYPQHCNPYENPGFVATPEQPQVNPIS